MRDYFQWLAMLDPDSWIIWLKVAFLSGPILLTVASLVLHLYVANRHLGALVEALSNCRYIATRAGLCNQGWSERIFLLSLIGGMVQWPGPGLRSGEMDPEDLKNLSAHLRKHLKVLHVLTWLIVVWMVLIYLLTELR